MSQLIYFIIINQNQSSLQFILIFLIILYLMLKLLIIILSLLSPSFSQFNLSIIPAIQVNNQPIQPINITINGTLKSQFNDEIYNQKTCCRSGNLFIYQLTSNQNNGTIDFIYNFSNGFILSNTSISISIDEKISNFAPTFSSSYSNNFSLNTNCPVTLTNDIYYSKVDVTITDNNANTYTFHFLLDCDYGSRHKGFQTGYIFIAIFNAVIMIGVALYSQIWSYQYNDLPIGITVNYKWFIPFTLIVVLAGSLLIALDYINAYNQDQKVLDVGLHIGGNIIAFFFLVICLNEIIFLYKKSRTKVFYFIRYCDIVSVSLSVTIILIIQFQTIDFITNDMLAFAVAVGCIKLLKFKNLKQAIICCFTVFLCQILASVAIHYGFPNQSYNDIIGRDTLSAIIVQIPALKNMLYRKCSWLSLSQIILPGSTNAYLRRFDYSRSSKLYFIFGNILFILSSIIWILVQTATVHTVPFASITYPSLFIPILLIAYKRGEIKIILNGTFTDLEFFDNQQQRDVMIRRSTEQSIAMKSSIISPLIFKQEQKKQEEKKEE